MVNHSLSTPAVDSAQDCIPIRLCNNLDQHRREMIATCGLAAWSQRQKLGWPGRRWPKHRQPVMGLSAHLRHASFPGAGNATSRPLVARWRALNSPDQACSCKKHLQAFLLLLTRWKGGGEELAPPLRIALCFPGIHQPSSQLFPPHCLVSTECCRHAWPSLESSCNGPCMSGGPCEYDNHEDEAGHQPAGPQPN